MNKSLSVGAWSVSTLWFWHSTRWTCWDEIIIIDRFYIALFPAVEQIHCAHVDVILNDWLYPFIARNIHRSGVLDSGICLLHGWCLMKLMPTRGTFCVHHSVMHQFTETLHSKRQKCGVKIPWDTRAEYQRAHGMDIHINTSFTDSHNSAQG